ncbi:hypothetical protein PR202_gb06603 [Eleusine coracana subsp. coracana]|uniref:histidine kinase n=1 Tax=Eleusine coracana subsp. coracana TaxID=191504 RepID=A0AAV5EAW2_ELECO|nr:hypothetical protein PR202_gb06603 [Eleusine coracana subsp. coracana]
MSRDAMAAETAGSTLATMVRRCGGCDGREDGAVEAMLQWQKVSDMLIAASILSIPSELLYFATREALAPLRRPLLQLGSFVVFCGVTHLLNAFAYDHPGNRRVLAALTAVKLLGAAAASAAAASLPIFFPRVIRLKLREDLLRAKARRLDRDLAVVRRRQGTAWRVARALAQRVRDAADACAVRRVAVLQLAVAFDLHNCAVWIPTTNRDGGAVLELAHQLVPDAQQVFDGGGGARATISVADPDVADVLACTEAKVLRPGSALGAASGGQQTGAAAAAIRLPVLRVSNSDDQRAQPEQHAILVLVLPPSNNDDNNRHGSQPGPSWSSQDLEIVQAISDQVAIALSHAAALEESQLVRHRLAEQQAALLKARHELAAATKARNAAHGAMRDAMRRPAHPIVGLLSVMQQHQEEATLRPEQRLVVGALARTTALSATLIDDVVVERLASSSATDPPPLTSPRMVARRPFELRSLVTDVASVAGCLSVCRGIGFSHQLDAGSLPEWVVGDDRRAFHVLLQMVDALLGRCHHNPHVACRVLWFSAGSCNDSAAVGDDQSWIPVPARHNFSGGGGGNQVFVKFQIGLRRAPPGNDPAETLPPPTPSRRGRPPRSPGSGRTNAQLSITMCNKIVQMMNGNMWSAPDSESLGETMTLVLRFQLQQPLTPHAPGSGIGASSSTVPQHDFNGLRILLADSDAMSLEVTRKLLERLGCQVVAVSSGINCLSLLATAGEPSSFQLVVLDLDAHGAGTAAAANGFEVAIRIRELSNSCWLLVLVALAGSGAAEDCGVRDMCRRAGVNGVIQKPITLPALGAELHRVLQNNLPIDGWVAICMHSPRPS